MTTQRLLDNQVSIGDAIKPYYGDEAGTKLTGLLNDHILIAADLVSAAKAGDKARVATEDARWRRNADEIASFLHNANPKQWPATAVRDAMFKHLDQTTAEATHRLRGDHTAEIKDYEEIVQHILMMADMLSDGIIAQFPSKFDTNFYRARRK